MNNMCRNSGRSLQWVFVSTLIQKVGVILPQDHNGGHFVATGLCPPPHNEWPDGTDVCWELTTYFTAGGATALPGC